MLNWFKKDTLGEKRRRELVKRIHDYYVEYSTHFGRHVFNIDDFQRRYDEVLDKNLSEEDFLESELEYIRSFSGRVQSVAGARGAQAVGGRSGERASASAKSAVAEIQKEFQRRYQSYPRLKISQKSPDEIEYLTGALVDFFKNQHQKTISFFKASRDSQIKSFVNDLKSYEAPLGVPFRDNLPKEFYDFKNDIAYVESKDEIQRRSQRVLKITFNYFSALKKLVFYVDNNAPVRSAYQKAGFYNFRDSLMKTVEKILYDFRLRGLV